MTNSKRTASLDEVLADFAHASQGFDAKVLQAFIDKYPEHARALQRYGHIQLTSMPATPDEVDEESLSDEEMLPRQSKLLQRMQQLRRVPSASDASGAAGKLASISGEQAMRAADELRHRAKEAEQNAGHWNSGTEGHAWRLRQAAEFRALAELVDASQTANTYEWPDTRALLDARQRVTDALAAVERAFKGDEHAESE